MKGKLLILTLTTLLLIYHCTLVLADETRNVTTNVSQIPLVGQHNFTFNLAGPSEIYLTTFQNDTKTILNFPSTTIIPTGQSQTTINVTYEIPFFADITNNTIHLQDIINVTNNITNSTIKLFLDYYIINDINVSAPNQTQGYLLVEEGGQHIIINAHTKVGFQTNYRVTIRTTHNSTVNISCARFIECPSNITTSETDDKVRFFANITIPENTALGDYTSSIEMFGEKSNATINFTIHIFGGDIIDTIIYDPVKNEKCYKNLTNFLECWKEKTVYDADIVNALDKLVNEQDACSENNTRTEYVEVGNLDKELFDENTKLRNDFNSCEEQRKTLIDRWDGCVSDKEGLSDQYNAKISQLGNESLQYKIQLERQAEREEQESRDKAEKRFNVVMGILFFCFFILSALGSLYFEPYGIYHNFPVKTVWSITGFLLLGWVFGAWMI